MRRINRSEVRPDLLEPWLEEDRITANGHDSSRAIAVKLDVPMEAVAIMAGWQARGAAAGITAVAPDDVEGAIATAIFGGFLAGANWQANYRKAEHG